MTMPFEQYIGILGAYCPPAQRRGQFAVNLLSEVHPLGNELRRNWYDACSDPDMSQAWQAYGDPFHDDRHLGPFLYWLGNNWGD